MVLASPSSKTQLFFFSRFKISFCWFLIWVKVFDWFFNIVAQGGWRDMISAIFQRKEETTWKLTRTTSSSPFNSSPVISLSPTLHRRPSSSSGNLSPTPFNGIPIRRRLTLKWKGLRLRRSPVSVIAWRCWEWWGYRRRWRWETSGWGWVDGGRPWRCSGFCRTTKRRWLSREGEEDGCGGFSKPWSSGAEPNMQTPS